MIKLFITEIQDNLIRENFRRIQKEINELQDILRGNLKFFEYTFDSAVTKFDFPHRLGFVPKEIIQTYITPGEAILWHWDSFDNTNVNVTTTGACTVRGYIGSYQREAGVL